MSVKSLVNKKLTVPGLETPPNYTQKETSKHFQNKAGDNNETNSTEIHITNMTYKYLAKFVKRLAYLCLIDAVIYVPHKQVARGSGCILVDV